MCGIVGAAASAGGLEGLPLEVQCDAMSHRGPDQRGLWWSGDRRVGLAHRRLSILDLSERGTQPMTSADGTVTIVLNGEIYNHKDLRARLQRLGHRFRSGTDTEVLLAAYHSWGRDCLAQLRGMFAFAIHDAEASVVFLARDRAGEKPLFYHHAQGRLSFASELKALLLDSSIPRRLDIDGLHEYLAYGYVAGGRSILHGVRKLPAGHAAVYDLETDSLRVDPYWQLPSAAPGEEDDEALADQLEGLLSEAVQEQLVADVPVGVLLSGGLDSSIVTALAARLSSSPVRTFTISFPGHGSYDEAPHAQLVADYLGTRHTRLDAEPATVDLLPTLARQYDEPLADSSMIPTYLVSQRIREHATVALGGDGADELFGGYPHYNWLHWQDRLRRGIPRVVRRGVSEASLRLPTGMRGRNHLVGLRGDAAEGLSRINLYFDELQRSRLLSPLGDRAARIETPEARRGAAVSPAQTLLQQATRLDFQQYLADDILTKVDRASMLCSLEVRAPFLDHRVINFAFGRLPDRLRATARFRKILLRKVGSRLLPQALDLRRKQGFSIPLHHWFKGQWGEYMREVLREAPVTLFDQNAIESLFRQQEKGRANGQRLFSLTMLELWRREYGVGSP